MITQQRAKEQEQKQEPTAITAPSLILGAKLSATSENTLEKQQKQQQQIRNQRPKLLDSCLRYNSDIANSLSDSEVAWNVIGVIGKLKTGCSTLSLNIAGNLEYSIGDSETQQQQHYSRTDGIELLTSPEHAIILDSQAVLDGRIHSDLPLSAPDYISEFHSLQIMILLLSICHTVVIVQDRLDDYEMMEFIKTALMLKYRIPDISTIGMIAYPSCNSFEPPPVAEEFTADLLFGFNNLSDELPLSEEDEFQVKHLISTSFPESSSSTNTNKQRVFFIPNKQSESLSVSSLSNSLESLTLSVLSTPKRSFKRPLSQKDWAKNVGNVWDLIQRSSVIVNYAKVLQKTTSY